MQESLWSEYYDLSSLRREWFPHADAQEEFEEIERALNEHGEATEARAACQPHLGR